MSKAENNNQLKSGKKGLPDNSTQDVISIVRQAFIIANQQKSLGNLSEAKNLYLQILQIDPNQPEALLHLGEIALHEKTFDTAIDLICKALLNKPNFAKAHFNLGNAYLAQGKLKLASNCYRKVVTLKPKFTRALTNLGATLLELGDLEEAAVCFRKAIIIQPDGFQAHKNLATILQNLGNLDEAELYVRIAIALNPDDAIIHSNFGSVLNDLGKPKEAMICYNKAISLRPDHPAFHFNLGHLLLLQGDLKQGWIEYNWRLKEKEKPIARTFPFKLWQGEPLKGKNILVYAEQGVGEEVMFASCIPDLIDLAPNKIFLDCEPRLKALFARSFPNVYASGRPRDLNVSWVGERTSIDYCLPIGSLLGFFRNSVDDFPKRDHYLIADQELTNKWRKRLSHIGDGLKVGISWSGGHKGIIDRKSIPLDQWKNLLSLDAYFINLQYGDTMEEIDQMCQDYGIEIIDWEDNDPMKDLDNQAALISALDLVITVNNTTSGFSGALGVPTWDMVDTIISPMMMNFEETTPFFPSLKLFRKQTYGGWEQVIKKIETTLQKRIEEHQV